MEPDDDTPQADEQPADDQSTEQSEEQPADSDQPAEQSDEQPAEQTDQPEQQSDDQPAGQSEEQPAESDQPAEQSEEQPADSDQPAEQTEDQTAESDQPAGQSDEPPADSDQPAEQAEEQSADSDQSEASASADNTLAFAGGDASPGGGGGGTFEARRPPRPSRTPALVKRRFNFGFKLSSDGVPDALQNKIPTLEGGELDFVINEEISPGKTQRVGDSVTASIDLEASVSGVVHFASTVGTNFSIEYIVSPPAGVGGTPLPRGNKVNPSDWKVTKIDAAGRKLNPGGAFLVSITVPVVFVLEQVQAGSTLDANLTSRDIDRTDITFQSPPKSGTDPAGNPVQEFEILIWGKPFFTATATKYLP